MASIQSTRCASPVYGFLSDPYAADPYSVFYVVFRALAEWPGYGIDTDGSVWSCRTSRSDRYSDNWRKLTQKTNRGGYRFVGLYRDRRVQWVLVHRLVLTTFVGSCPEGLEACHFDGCRTNNRLSNLRWDDHRSNAADMRRHGRLYSGGDSPGATLNVAAAQEILAARRGGETYISLARRFGVSVGTISNVLQGRHWAVVASHVGGPTAGKGAETR